MVTGERLVAAGIGLFGAVWIVQSGRLPYWGEFAPGSGFLPFWLGALLVALSAAFLVLSLVRPAEGPEPATGPGQRRVLAIVLGLFACIAVLEWVGFVAAISAYLLFLAAWVERRPWSEAVAVAVGAAAGLWLVFGYWLRVPLPVGPWGF